MALTDEQLEIISDVLIPLFQYLEHEVIVDVANRIKNSLAYTRTAELEAESMQRLGYSPVKIRAAVMKLLKADAEFQKVVANNTLEHKKEVKRILQDIMKAAQSEKDDILSKTADLSYLDDLGIWEQGGKQLTENSFLPQLVDAMRQQTKEVFKNISRTTGFKTMSGYEAMESLYQKELDKAMIKVCTGTFSRDQIVYDTVHNLASSGLRTIDFASGKSMQLDTAVKLAVRTGAHQLAGKITDKNIEQTGENLVYVSKHWGARNTGTGHANHELWQGKVYFIKEGQDYSEEAKRIGQDRITDLWYATGYSADGSHENDPVGLDGYNCRHNHYVWFEGISNFPQEDPEPEPVTINGKTYDYYAITQKQRSMERAVRGMKREREALKTLNMDTKEISTKIKQKIREYEEFCNTAKVDAKNNRLRYECGTSDLKKTEAWKRYSEMPSAKSNNVGQQVFFDENKDYNIKLEGYSPQITSSLSQAAKEVAIEGSRTGYEHMALVDMDNGEIVCRHTDNLQNQVGGKELYDYLKAHSTSKYAFIHNHNRATELSLGDIELMANNEQIIAIAAVRNDGIISVVKSNGKHTTDFLPLRYDEELSEYRLKKYGKRVPMEKYAEYSLASELFLRSLAIEEFSDGGMIIYE